MTQLELATDALIRLIGDVVRFGGDGQETAAILLSSRHDRHADILALCGERGIERRPDQLVISGAALALLFDWADEVGAQVIAQVHSHGGLARMSPTDRRFGLTVEGFTSAIIPYFAEPPDDPSAWGWWRFQERAWVTAASFIPEFEATLPDESIAIAEFSSRLGDFFRALWRADPPSAAPGEAMSFLVAGFDPGDAYARVFQLDIPNTVTPIEQFLSPHQPPFGARWGGQRKIVERLLGGFDPLLPEMVRKRLNLDPKQMDELRDAVSVLGLPVPWEAMALQDCIDLAIFGIRSTISAQALSVEVRGCGGPIDVAVITRRDGLRFVQRKKLVGDRSAPAAP